MAAGNGAAIRVAPLALALDLRSPRSRQQLRDVSRITHHSDEAYVGALAIALTIEHGLAGWRGRDALFETLLAELPDTRVRDRLEEVEAAKGRSVVEVAARFGSSGYVVESVPLAIHAYCSAVEADFVEMVEQLVAVGGDCDSIASMAGQCLGVLRGEGALPAPLVGQLPSVVGRVADELAAIFD